MNTFDKISKKYEEKSLVQQNAASKLSDLLGIKTHDDIIDIACGPGSITKKLKSKTQGKVTGIDISQGMITQAKSLYPEIEFRQIAVEDMDYECEFDIAFCNSSFQWFSDPDRAMNAIFRSLRPKGKLGLACPATPDWSSMFAMIISQVSQKKEIKDIFSHWKNPWFFLPAEIDYKLFFEKHGFFTIFINIEHEKTIYSTDEAFNIYLSGAANGYTDKKYYDIKIDDYYVTAFNNGVKEEIKRQAIDGRIIVDFCRLYYIGQKEK